MRHPLTGAVAHTLYVRAGGVATSGIDARLWQRGDGDLRPPPDRSVRRELPAWTGLVAVTALAPTALEAEALAKAALLSGPAAGRRLLRAHHGGVLVHDDGRSIPSSADGSARRIPRSTASIRKLRSAGGVDDRLDRSHREPLARCCGRGRSARANSRRFSRQHGFPLQRPGEPAGAGAPRPRPARSPRRATGFARRRRRPARPRRRTRPPPRGRRRSPRRGRLRARPSRGCGFSLCEKTTNAPPWYRDRTQNTIGPSKLTTARAISAPNSSCHSRSDSGDPSKPARFASTTIGRRPAAALSARAIFLAARGNSVPAVHCSGPSAGIVPRPAAAAGTRSRSATPASLRDARPTRPRPRRRASPPSARAAGGRSRSPRASPSGCRTAACARGSADRRTRPRSASAAEPGARAGPRRRRDRADPTCAPGAESARRAPRRCARSSEAARGKRRRDRRPSTAPGRWAP